MDIQVTGVTGMVYRRGRQIVLTNATTEKKVAVNVLQYGSMQGWLAENGEGDWQWYREIKQDNDPEETEYWKYIKEVGT